MKSLYINFFKKQHNQKPTEGNINQLIEILQPDSKKRKWKYNSLKSVVEFFKTETEISNNHVLDALQTQALRHAEKFLIEKKSSEEEKRTAEDQNERRRAEEKKTAQEQNRRVEAEEQRRKEEEKRMLMEKKSIKELIQTDEVKLNLNEDDAKKLIEINDKFRDGKPIKKLDTISLSLTAFYDDEAIDSFRLTPIHTEIKA